MSKESDLEAECQRLREKWDTAFNLHLDPTDVVGGLQKRIMELEDENQALRTDSGQQMTRITCLEQDRVTLKIENQKLRELLKRLMPWVIGVESNEKLLEELRAALEGKE